MASLGTTSQLTIGTSNLQDSLDFYYKLGFRLVTAGDRPYNWCKITDGSILLFLNENGSHYMGFSYFSIQWDALLEHLKKLGVVFVQDLPREKSFFTPHDILITLVRQNEMPSYSVLKDYVSLGPEIFKYKEKLPNQVLGAFGELACPSQNVKDDMQYYIDLGFSVITNETSPYPWCILNDGLNTIGLHQTKDFDQNSITYFSPDVKVQVKKLQDRGMQNITEFTGTGGDENNVCIQSPENQNIFLFKS